MTDTDPPRQSRFEFELNAAWFEDGLQRFLAVTLPPIDAPAGAAGQVKWWTFPSLAVAAFALMAVDEQWAIQLLVVAVVLGVVYFWVLRPLWPLFRSGSPWRRDVDRDLITRGLRTGFKEHPRAGARMEVRLSHAGVAAGSVGVAAEPSTWGGFERIQLYPDGCLLIAGRKSFTWLPYRALVEGDADSTAKIVRECFPGLSVESDFG